MVKVKNTQAKTIMIVSQSGTFARDVLEGIFDYTHIGKDWLFKMCPPDGRRRSEFKKNPPDGVLVIGSREDRPWLAEWKGPLVGLSVDKTASGPCVHVDQVRAGTLGCNYFINKAFTRLGHVGLMSHLSSRNQRQGFLEAAKLAGITAKALELADDEFRWQELGKTLLDWRSQGPEPLALLAANGEVALRICQACRFAGLTVPDDVAVLGVSMRRQAEALCRPVLSSVSMPGKLVGREGARLLDQLMNGEVMNGLVLKVPPVHITERESTSMLACADEIVEKVFAYVRAHSHEPIGVEELANLAGMSRRALEKHFRSVLGQTIFHVIRHQQLAHACQLIEESNLPFEEIVEQTAFSSASHLTRELEKKTGLSPGAYRKAVNGKSGSRQSANRKPQPCLLITDHLFGK